MLKYIECLETDDWLWPEEEKKKKNEVSYEEEVVVGDADDLDLFFSFLCSDCFLHCHHDVFVQCSLILVG